MRFVAAWVGLLGLTVSASGQVIYTPVQYQFGQGTNNPYYYGGHDGRVFHMAEAPNNTTQGQVYSDDVPYANAATYGYGPDDARNEANRNIPRYFRKRDLLAGAAVQPDGSAVVPAESAGIPAREVARTPHNAAPILIIPKRMLERPKELQMAAAPAASHGE